MKQAVLIAIISMTFLYCRPLIAGEAISLGDVVVTATRTDTPEDKVGGTDITVLTQKDITAKHQNTVEEVLKDVPGLDVVTNGGPGTNASIFMRGGDAKNTLILVDGVMLNDPASVDRSANLADLTTDNIDRIEIIRGPMSALYGSNATGGVINIITKKGTGKPKSSFGVEGGSYNTWKEYASSSGSSGRFNYSINISHINSDGFSIADDRNDRIPHAGNTSEKDGWHNTTLSGRTGFQINPDFEVNATLRLINSSVDLDDFGPGYAGDRFSSWPYTAEPNGLKDDHTNNRQYLGRFEVKNKLFSGLLKSKLYSQILHQERTGYDNDGNKSWDYLGKNLETGWQGTFAVTKTNDLSLGTSYYREGMKSDSSNIDNRTADTKSIWLGDQASLFSRLDLDTALRHDDHDRFGGKTTYRIAPSYLIGSGTTVKASYGTGFRAPSLFELYSIYGNTDLKPEESRGWDVGVEQEMFGEKVVCGLTYFAMDYKDRIAYDYLTSTYGQAPGETRTKGVEAFIRYKLNKNMLLKANYTYTSTKDPDGSALPHIPRNKFGINANYHTGKFSFNTDLRWLGRRDANTFAEDMNGNPVTTLDPYTVVNLAASYQLTDRIQIYGRIDNLFDEYYEEVWSYATPGRSAYVGVKMSF